jgi:hypothetical protein
MSAPAVVAADRDAALDAAMEMARRRHREGRSARWLYGRIEAIEGNGGGAFFTEDEIWEMVEAF